MSSIYFPSGPWLGFFTYNGIKKQYLMDLRLEFRNGIVRGDGTDRTGFFQIAGSFSDREADCSWVKVYSHGQSLIYKGYREGKGIWGTWELGGVKGGFHIWPRAEEETSDVLLEEKHFDTEWTKSVPDEREDLELAPFEKEMVA